MTGERGANLNQAGRNQAWSIFAIFAKVSFKFNFHFYLIVYNDSVELLVEISSY